MKASKADREIIAVVATNVRDARKAAGLSQEALADAAGVDRTYVSQVERRLRNLTIVALAEIGEGAWNNAGPLVGRNESGFTDAASADGRTVDRKRTSVTSAMAPTGYHALRRRDA